MQNKNLLHRIIKFVEAELGLTLAIMLILGTVIVSGATAYISPTLLDTGDIENPAAIVYSSVPSNNQLIINQIKVNGLNFTARPEQDLYRVTTGWQGNNQDLITTCQGTHGASTNKTYIYRIDLDRPYSGMVWLAGRYESAEINGVTVTPSQALINLDRTSKLTLKFKGGDANTFATLTKVEDNSYPRVMLASASPTDLVVIPNKTEVTIGGQIQLQAVEVDGFGRALATNPIWQVEESSKNIISVDNTGLVTGLTPGHGYVITKTGQTTTYSEVLVKSTFKTITAALSQSHLLQPVNLFTSMFDRIIK